MRFTHEQLSRILGEHEAGRLKRDGEYDEVAFAHGAPVCVNQAAYNELWMYLSPESTHDAAVWFDSNYNPAWTSDEFLAAMEGAGL